MFFFILSRHLTSERYTYHAGEEECRVLPCAKEECLTSNLKFNKSLSNLANELQFEVNFHVVTRTKSMTEGSGALMTQLAQFLFLTKPMATVWHKKMAPCNAFQSCSRIAMGVKGKQKAGGREILVSKYSFCKISTLNLNNLGSYKKLRGRSEPVTLFPHNLIFVLTETASCLGNQVF